MRQLKFIIGIIVFAIPIVLNTKVWGVNWKYLCGDTQRKLYYDAENITYPSGNIVRIWVRAFYPKRETFVDKFGKTRIEKVKFTVYLFDLHCTNKVFKLLQEMPYSGDGELLYLGNYFKESNWEVIPPNTFIEYLHLKMCGK